MLVRVEAWPDELEALGLDVWTHRATSAEVLVRVTAPQRAQLDATGFAYTIVEPDLGPQVEAEAARLAAAPRPATDVLDPSYYDEYRDLDDVLERLKTLAVFHSERATRVELGTSLEGRPIVGLRLTNSGDDERPIVTVVACQHAREWVAAAATVWAMEQLAAASKGDPLDVLLDEAELVVIPVLNPDGYAHSWDRERFWRKNRRDAVGVDLNRNWSVAWGGTGSSPYPPDENYRGAAPFSEPETIALRDFLEGEPRAVAMLDVHSYSQLVLYPWGFDTADAPDDALYSDLGRDIADAMVLPYGTSYLPLQAADFYPASGNAMDWAYGQRGLHAFGLELRPGPDMEPGFLLGPEHIVPTGRELLAAITTLTEAAVTLGPGEAGDSGGPVPPGEDTSGDDGSSDSSGTSLATETGLAPPEPGGTAGSDTGTPGPMMTDEPSEPAGCGCHASPRAPGPGTLLLGLGVVLLGARRRR